MKALSIQQPWAWLIVNGHKDIENRNWWTNQRGVILIHAGKKLDEEGLAWVRRNFPMLKINTDALMRGGIVGRANIVDCVKQSDSPWFIGRYGFVLQHAWPLEFEPCRGQLGFFEVDYK